VTLSRVTAGKNLALLRHRGEAAIDRAAERTRARFATPGKHQIYADKRAEAEAYLAAQEAGEAIDMDRFPYLAAEAGTTAPTPGSLAALWLDMNRQWQQVAAAVEQVTVAAKAQVRAAPGAAAIDAVVAQASAVLDGIGTPPPEPPKP